MVVVTKMYTEQEMQKIFEGVYGGGMNFMTPNLISLHYLNDDLVAELSSGRGLLPETTLYGVTVLKRTDGSWERTGQPLSDGFQSRQAALLHIEGLAGA